MTARTTWRGAPSRPLAVCAGLVLAAALLGPPVAASTSSGSTSSGNTSGPSSSGASPVDALLSAEGVEVPVHGVVRYPAAVGSAELVPVTAAVHGVQRVEGATVLYWSAGTREAAGLTSQTLGDRSSQPVRSWTAYDWTGYAQLSDPLRLEGLDGSTIDQRTNLSSPSSAFPRDSPGTMWVMFQVFPELPEQTSTVDVTLGTGATVHDVPVLDGPLEPVLPADEPIALGDGWPEIDPALLGADPSPDESRFPLALERSSLDGSQTVVEETDEVRVDLSADVLFEVDSAEVGPDAVARLEELAATINADALPGPLGVVGHTDSDGRDDYNLDLSTRRAQAVADVLLPLLQVDGLQPAVEGRGEAEPVQPNTTDEGKQANRRVSVTYVPDQAEETP